LAVVSLRKLGRYDIIRVLGKGAMGIVYEGRDPNLDRRVAIKTVKVENLAPEAAAEYEARFRTEARSAARLQHPNIVSVYDSDRHEDIAYLVMEYIQGDDLKHHLDNGDRYSLEQSLHMIDDLLSALDYAHRHGVVHRDIKPANLLLEASGRLKLTDFGVARMQDAEATRTQGAMVGTLKYMAPEQVQGQKIDTRADLFAVGVILYQLLTDQRPFDGENEFAIIHQIIGHTPPAPSAVNARLPTAIDAVVARALAKKPDDRYASAGEFAAALRSAVRHAEDPTIVPPVNPARLRPGALRSVTSPGTSPMGSATVTQELELVYWKDVKDSNDPEDLEVFLAKFPAGIYADLARRRLRKLRTEPSPDQTVLSGADADPAGTPTVPSREPVLVDGTAPRVGALERAYARTIAPMEAAAAPVFAPGARQEPTVPLATALSTRSEPALLDLTVPTVAKEAAQHEQTTIPLTPRPPAVDPDTAPADVTVARESAPPAARTLSAPVLAALGALALVGIAAVTMLGRSSDDGPAIAASGAASAALTVPVLAVPEPAGASGRSAAVTPAATGVEATVPGHAALPSSARARVAASVVKRTTPKSTTPAGPAEMARTPAEPTAPSVVREPPRVSPATTTARGASSPVEACRDKMFLALEFCLAEQCEKTAARNHPLCVKWREQKKLREDSKPPD
jgi:eukaryotic-like serine/threonine-protein kinase